ncbi:MAG: hypothetical protein CMJ48_07930 [Planctomycetaceae bacterium]|nr:hypothetical protein [Planctomycetaceae bacterium]
MTSAVGFPRRLRLATMLYALVWAGCLADWMWLQQLKWAVAIGKVSVNPIHWIGFLGALLLVILWLRWTRGPVRQQGVRVSAVFSGSYIVCWQLAVFTCDQLILDELRTWLARCGTGGLFLIGLAWIIWYVDSRALALRARRCERQGRSTNRREPSTRLEFGEGRVWNPLDTDAWYYGRGSRKLNQSLTAFLSYALAFTLALLLFSQMRGCRELYEMPAGGGQQQTIAQTVRVQKIIKKKFVVNQFSSIVFEVPPIDEVKLQLQEITKHQYVVGYGQGTGAGYAGGTQRGKVRFIRLEYSGGDWDQDFGIGADLNMLIEYGTRTSQKVANRTESRSVAQLKNFPVGKSPPLVYLTGQKNIVMSKHEIKTLREYVTEKHGMIFGDNGGSRHFHNQFLSTMRQVLPNVRPVPVPLDDVIHRVPYQIPFLPYVAPHGGKDALGWKVDGRWVCYYHPGDIGDAWTDDHSGVKPEIYEFCYQLGVNVINYAHAEYSKWLQSRMKK